MPTLSPFGLLDRFVHGGSHRAPDVQPALPLQGITILAVEDSRFSSDALRLLCQRSGARLRRVDRLAHAYAHLRVYRPDVALVDMGLPDGNGDSLIHDLARLRPQGPIILAISGDPDARGAALAAGADAFVDKPFRSITAFQDTILAQLPDRANRVQTSATDAPILPDPMALHDDLKHAAGLLSQNPDSGHRRYLARFVAGIARSANDPTLAAAAHGLTAEGGVDRLSQILAHRIDAATHAFRGCAS